VDLPHIPENVVSLNSTIQLSISSNRGVPQGCQKNIKVRVEDILYQPERAGDYHRSSLTANLSGDNDAHLVGFLDDFLNAIAGIGSFITLPTLIVLSLKPITANCHKGRDNCGSDTF
jgi:hypothetical protein